jgi:phosphoribosyl 1,2-cyclic phosphate phosphodiesterase
MLRENVEKLDAVLFTHEHKDHIAGLDDVRGFNFILNKPMDVYCTQRVLTALKREFYYVFSEENYPGIPRLNIHLINETEDFWIGDLKITPIQCMHAQLPVLGYRINDFAYITDANFISAEEKKKLKNLNVLVLNALRHEPHLSHFTLSEAIDLVKELNPLKAYFTHISHQLGLHQSVQKTLPDNCYLAYDGLKITMV